MEGSVLVIGGGIAGIQTSLDLTELGYKVYLIEEKPSIGGHMAQFDKLFPNNDCALCVLAPKMVSVYRNPNIELLTLSKVIRASGTAGDFDITILKRPRYVDESKCRGCGDCASKCPKIEVPNLFDMNLGKRKSIYIPYPQATPPVYVIDPELCLFLNRNVCGVCQKVCKAKAIDFEQQSEEIDINVGAIVVATGFNMLGRELDLKWSYNSKNVVNALEYERMLSPTGPFGTHLLRPSDEKEPKKIAFIQCVGLGYSEDNIPYCSRVCCMYTAKNAKLTKQYAENSEITVFRHNIRVFGRDFYEYTKTAQDEYGINYINSKIINIEEDRKTNDLIIKYKDMTSRKEESYNANLLVLAAPLIPSEGTKELAKILGIELDRYDFFKSQSYFNKSLSTKEGIYLSGFIQSPMNISETVTNASGVASEIATLLKSERFSQIKKRLIDILPENQVINITPRALIIGGGVSGMTAALNLGNQGFEVLLLEKQNQLGGNLNYINLLYPTQQSGSDFLFNIEEEVRNHPKIKIFLNSEIEDITGSIGNYSISFLDINRKVRNFGVGIIIIATGGQEFKPFGLFQYNKSNKNVLTLLELENKLKSKDFSWIKKIKNITFILCVKARQKEGFSYCSNVCCSNSIKNMKILKEINPNAQIHVLFRDLHMAKKEFEEIFSERKYVADYVKYDLKNIPEIVKIREVPEKYLIKIIDARNPEKFIEFNSDLVILATPLIPPDDLTQLSLLLDLPLDDNGFFIEAHRKLRPLDFMGQGIFVCGSAQWPKNIQDCISEANGAAGRASRFLSLDQISTTKVEILSFLLSIECFFKDMEVNVDKCNGCGRCVEVCEFKAISLIDANQEYEDVSVPAKKAYINPAICKGCGRCSATCRLKAIDPRHYDFNQISAIIDPYFLSGIKSEQELPKDGQMPVLP
ncbi:MAG: CoB--CoM heterodisulfide reductase iron-sulfur subunit A family protein [Promethearchaeota archaeon]|nr:MAG: CoB--CoM heterodisulfide reductase iron-sulfur subunit A family protein [Candidatus Lokiarchaeota archaeon]